MNGLNAAEGAYAKSTGPKERIALQSALKFNGGGQWAFVSYLYSFRSLSPFRSHRFDAPGHINHSLFWKNLAPAADKGGKGGVLADGPLKDAIEQTWGSVDNSTLR